MGDVKLLLLIIIISVASLVLSAMLHFCSLFPIYEPPRELLVLICISSIAVIYWATVIVQKTHNEVYVKNVIKALFGACPGWLLTMTGLFMMYALGWQIFFILMRFFSGSDGISGQRDITSYSSRCLSGWMMAFNSIAFMIFYSYKRLRERHSGDR